MTPGARIQATIDLVEALEAGWRNPSRPPADALINQYFKARRYIGSKDRGDIAARAYFILRHRATLLWWIERGGQQVTARKLVLACLALHEKPGDVSALFNGEKHHPAPLSAEEKRLLQALHKQPLRHNDMPNYVRFNYQPWMGPELKAACGDTLEAAMLAMNEEAPVDLRVNGLKATPEQVLTALREAGMEAAPIPRLPNGLRLQKRGALFATEAFKNGWFEMQDAGSQLVALLAQAKPGHKVIDFCAGAGGKTLALAADMHNRGRILAWDVSASRLEQMAPRLRRAGVDNVQRHLITSEADAFIKRHKASADRVLVDAPCSGSGTWRRNPDLKWRSTEQDFKEILKLQARILESAARLVKPGGWLIYITCSLFESENERQVEAFIAARSNFVVVSPEKIWDKNFPELTTLHEAYLRLSPQQDGTDGFFAAVMEHTGVPHHE